MTFTHHHAVDKPSYGSGTLSYFIEFKRDESAEKALSQIKDKGYHEKYRAWSNGFEKKVHLLGINFSTEKRNIESWKEEIID